MWSGPSKGVVRRRRLLAATLTLTLTSTLVLLGLAGGCSGAPLAGADGGADDGALDGAQHDAGDAGDAGDSGAPDVGPACVDVPAAGHCVGEVLQTCVAGALSERDCAAESLRCLAAAGAPPRCGAAPTGCADLPDAPGGPGLCAGEVLYFCHAEWLRQVSCASLGGRCGVGGGRPGCEARAGGARQATGTVTADKRPYDENGLGAAGAVAAEGVTVVVHRAADDVALGLGVTDAQGRFDIAYDNGGPDGVYLRVGAFQFTASHRLWVTDDADATYAFESAAVEDSAGQVTQDVHVAEADDAGALSIFGVLARDQAVATALAQTPLPPLQAQWERGQRLFCGTCHSVGRIFVLGEPDDTDEYDDCVLSHEFGHYLAWAASRDDTPGGAHDGTPTDPRLAWSEGLATWIGLTVLDETIYIDTKATGATVRDPEDLGWDADPTGPLDQAISEHVVLETLWDLTDPTGPADPMARPALDVLAVLTGYLPSPGMADRAHPGVDLVDFLDGWLCQGLGDAAGLSTLVVDGQGFPYDFAGPAAPCPKPEAPTRVVLQWVPDRGRAARAAGRVALTVVDRPGSPAARARLVLPPGQQAVEPAERALGPAAADAPLRVTWRLSGGAPPAWVRVGVTLDRGRGVDHVSVSLGQRPAAPAGHPVRRISLGGLLALRVRRGR